MNNENLEFLQTSLKYHGFGENTPLNAHLEDQINNQVKEFQLEAEVFYSEKAKIEAILYFKKSDNLDMYFFNKYIATLSVADDPEAGKSQTFYMDRGSGISLKEAFNLLEGRAVNKDLITKDGIKYNAWIQLNFNEKDSHDNYKVKQYRSEYGYDLEKHLNRYPISELADSAMQAALIRSLKKGNQHPVTFEMATRKEKYYIEANPQFKTINIYPRPKLKKEPENSSAPNDNLKQHSENKDMPGDDIEDGLKPARRPKRR